jgi:hemerythrin-like metal-binding protein/PAS domain S-box-containing protein
VAIFVWSDEYNIGYVQVDKQHQRLVSMLNRLDASISEGAETAAIAGLLSELKSYTEYHFSTEEQLMRDGAGNAEHVRTHLQQHRAFERSLEQMIRVYNESGSVVAGSLLEFLVRWLMSHILGSDQEMGRLLRGDHAAHKHGDRERIRQLQGRLDQEIAQRNMLIALREADSRLRVIADTVPCLVWMADAAGRRTFFNRTWLDFTGRGAGDELGWGWLDGVHHDDRAQLFATCMRALQSRQPYTAEFRLRRRDGDYRWVIENASPRESAEGSFVGCIGSTTDITDRKRVEQELDRTRATLERMLAERDAEIERVSTDLPRSAGMGPGGGIGRQIAEQLDDALGRIAASAGRLNEGLSELYRLVDAYRIARAGPDQAAAQDPAVGMEREVDLTSLRQDLSSQIDATREALGRIRQVLDAALAGTGQDAPAASRATDGQREVVG